MSRTSLPLDATIALAQQKLAELLRIRPLDAMEAGDFGDLAQSKKIDTLLGDLHELIGKARAALREGVRRKSPMLGLTLNHSAFLRSELLPLAPRLQRLYFRDSLLQALFTQDQNPDPEAVSSVQKDAIRFTADYCRLQLDQDDDRQLEADIVLELLEQAWFQPDLWSANLRSLRPVILGVDPSRVPARIQVRLGEMHRSFTFGAWMATVALSRALIEFALTERASALAFAATNRHRDQERYLRLDDLIHHAVQAKPELEQPLRRIQEAANHILHPKKNQNVVQLPKVLRSEALGCVEAATAAMEIMYAGAGE